ncbi:MAG: type II secretion system protein GspL, partial [Moraxellaceae bacterium]
IEEQVGEDVENLLVVAGHADASDRLPLLAVASDYLAAVLREMKDHGWQVHAVLPDLLLLPHSTGQWALLADDCGLRLRTGTLAGAALESDAGLLLRAAANDELPHAVEAFVAPGHAEHAALAAWAAEHDVDLHLHEDAESAVITRLASTDWRTEPGNLLQQAFATAAPPLLPRALHIAAVFLLVAFCVQLLSEWTRYFYFRHQAAKTQAATVALYRELFPEERRVQDVRRQMEAHLRNGGATSQSLPVLTRIAEAMQGSGLATQRVDYSGGVFMVDVEARGLGDIDAFKQRLEGQGMTAEIVSANAGSGGAIRGRLRVEGGA